MKLLVYEYITGGGLLREALEGALLAEGLKMVTTLIDDCIELEHVELTAVCDWRLKHYVQSLEKLGVSTVIASSNDNWRTLLHRGMTQCDLVWPIAPETEGVLETVCNLARSSGTAAIMSSIDSIAICSSKLRTCGVLNEANIAVVPTVDLNGIDQIGHGIWVLKPDDGVGGEQTCIISNMEDIAAWVDRFENKNWILQPFIDGEPLSLSVLMARGKAQLLSINRQHIDCSTGEIRFTGCTVGAYHDETGRLQELCTNIAQKLPGLWGYIGIDLIKTNEGLVVLEINPRLTTSYAGLSQSLKINPSEWILTLWQTGEWPDLNVVNEAVPVDVTIS